jgi:hypothetical protein
MEGIALPKYIVYAEIYDFSVSYAETYDKGKTIRLTPPSLVFRSGW